jgi:hypothetical protein
MADERSGLSTSGEGALAQDQNLWEACFGGNPSFFGGNIVLEGTVLAIKKHMFLPELLEC